GAPDWAVPTAAPGLAVPTGAASGSGPPAGPPGAAADSGPTTGPPGAAGSGPTGPTAANRSPAVRTPGSRVPSPWWWRRLRPRAGYPARGAIPVTTWLRSSASASARQRREPEGEGLLPRRQHVLRQRERPAGGRAHAVEGGGDGHPGAAVGA